MDKYGVSLRDIITALDPHFRSRAEPRAPTPRRQRQVKVYKHPETGEVIETKGGNHGVLKKWNAEHGAQVVEGWLQ